MRCGPGTELRDGQCDVSRAPEPGPDAGQEPLDDGGVVSPSPFAAGCTSLRLVARTSFPGVVSPTILALDDGTAFAVYRGGGVFAQALDTYGRMRGEARAVADHLGTGTSLNGLASAALPGARVGIRWFESQGPSSLASGIAVLGPSLDALKKTVLPNDTFSPLAAAGTKAGALRVVGKRFEEGRSKLLVVDHSPSGAVVSEREIALAEGARAIASEVALLPSDDGGTLLVAAVAPASGTGRELVVLPIDASGVPGTARIVASLRAPAPFRAVSTGDGVLVALGDGAFGPGGTPAATLGVTVFAIATSPPSAREIGTYAVPVGPLHAADAQLVWSGARGWLVTQGQTLSARAIDRAGRVGPEQVLTEDYDLVDVGVGAARDALVAAWVAGTGKARAGQLATFGCAP